MWSTPPFPPPLFWVSFVPIFENCFCLFRFRAIFSRYNFIKSQTLGRHWIGLTRGSKEVYAVSGHQRAPYIHFSNSIFKITSVIWDKSKCMKILTHINQTDRRSVGNQCIVIFIMLCVPIESASVNRKGLVPVLRLLLRLAIKTRKLLSPTVTAVWIRNHPQPISIYRKICLTSHAPSAIVAHHRKYRFYCYKKMTLKCFSGWGVIDRLRAGSSLCSLSCLWVDIVQSWKREKHIEVCFNVVTNIKVFFNFSIRGRHWVRACQKVHSVFEW